MASVLPDIPMILFNAVQRIARGESEERIWNELYYVEGWQAFFDTFNSVPIVVCGILAGLVRRFKVTVFFCSMLLHIACDFPPHHDEAHRHLFPLSDWRFASPVWYWDPNYFGQWFLIVETCLVGLCAIVSYRASASLRERVMIRTIVAVYLAYWGFVSFAWL